MGRWGDGEQTYLCSVFCCVANEVCRAQSACKIKRQTSTLQGGAISPDIRGRRAGPLVMCPTFEGPQ